MPSAVTGSHCWRPWLPYSPSRLPLWLVPQDSAVPGAATDTRPKPPAWAGMNASMTTSGVLDPADEVVDLLGDLIRINTSNPTHPERPAAEWVAEQLAEVGIDAQIFESEPGRASMVARIAGTDPSRAPLLIHGHLDVVPADAAEWTVDPFSGEVRDGYVWGRGAIDMKDMDAMTLAVLRNWARRESPAAARHRACLRGRRGGGRARGRALAGRQPPRAVRRLHRGHQRGRRLQRLDRQRPAALSDPDRGERHQLAAASGDGHARATVRCCTTTMR